MKVSTVLPTVPKEIILVDDGSTDGTREWLTQTFAQTNGETVAIALDPHQEKITILPDIQPPKSPLSSAPNPPIILNIKVIFHPKNQGKGAALRTGFQAATGDVLVIQDADLEYNPEDWKDMWDLIVNGYADVVYGSRFYGKPHRVLYIHHLLANKLISFLVDLVCNTTLTDIEVCYKMFRREVLEGLKLTSNDFGFEVEFTVRVTTSRRKWSIYETGICYYGRTYDQGKKINWKDGVKALWYIFWFRFFG